MIDLDSAQIIKENDEPKFAVLNYKVFQELKEIVEDYLDHLHAESILKNTTENDWVDFEHVKKELRIK